MKNTIVGRVLLFYWDGFRHMNTWGRQVWLVILLKLFIMFAILKVFFFPDILKTKYTTDQQRSEHVLENLTNIK